MATNFIQQSEEYLRQIDAEVEQLQQLRTQVQAIIQSEVVLERSDASPANQGVKTAGKRKYTRRAPVTQEKTSAVKRPYNRRVPSPAAKKTATKKTATKKVANKKTSAKKTAPTTSEE